MYFKRALTVFLFANSTDFTKTNTPKTTDPQLFKMAYLKRVSTTEKMSKFQKYIKKGNKMSVTN